MTKKYIAMDTPIINGENIIQSIETNTGKIYVVRSIRDYNNRYHDYWTRAYRVTSGDVESKDPNYVDFYDTREQMIVGHNRAVEYLKNKY